MMVKAKGNYDEVRERLKFVIEENSKNNETYKAYEDKISSMQFMVQSMKFKLTQKENEINTLKEDMKALENYKADKAKYEKKIMDCTNTITALKDELE
jgi:predicted nuclease with TOPRIM domain